MRNELSERNGRVEREKREERRRETYPEIVPDHSKLKADGTSSETSLAFEDGGGLGKEEGKLGGCRFGGKRKRSGSE